MKKILIVFGTLELLLQNYFWKIGWGVSNRGVSFGLGERLNFYPWPMLIIVAILGWGLWRKKITALGYWFLFTGGLVNLLMRLSTGIVWDYWHWSYGFDLWFNGADILITLGAVSLIWK